MSLCYDYEHNEDYGASRFKAAMLKLVGAKRPFDARQIKKDLKNFPAQVWNQHNKDATMHCFFKRCHDDEEQFKQCLALPALCAEAFCFSRKGALVRRS